MDRTFFDQIAEDFKKKRDTIYKRTDVPPWVKRKEFEIQRSVLDPFVSRDLSVLKVCSTDTISEHRGVLIKYLNETHNLSYEMSETWVTAFGTRNMDMVVNREWQIDGLKYFDDESQTATSGITPASSYRAMRMNIDRDRSYVNLHIGSSATKQDLVWFIKNTWEKDVGSVVETKAFRGRVRALEALRRFVAARLKAQGESPKDVRRYCEDMFEADLDDSSYRKPIPQPTYEQDLFFEARAQLGSALGKKIESGDPTYELIVDKLNYGHFKLK